MGLNDFYYNSLNGTINELEKQRKDIVFRLVVINITLLAISYILYFYISFFTIIFFLMASRWAYSHLTYNYYQDFKAFIIKPLINQIDKNLLYEQQNSIPQMVFDSSMLFQRPDRYHGSDLIKGVIDGVNIKLSHINALYKTQDKDGKTSYGTIFEGVFIVADFNKNFLGNTIILPDYSEKIFGNMISSWLQKTSFSRGKLIKLDDIAFEREFKVYGSDEVEAHYILSHSLMKKILDLKAKTNSTIYISFVNNHIYIAISGLSTSYNPPLFSSLLEFKVASSYTQTLSLSLGVIDELKLNQKLFK